MGKTFKHNKITGLDQYKMARKSWGNCKPGTRVETPKKGGGYKRKQKFGNRWED